MIDSKQFDISKIPVFLPISSICILWQFLILIFIIADFVVTVMVQCFVDYPQLSNILYNYFDNIMVVFLSLDILYSFNTCIINKGVVISDRKQIALNYIKSIYFWVDLLSLITSILQLALNSNENYSTGYNFIVFIKIIKVFLFDRNIKRYALKSFNALLFYQIAKNILFLALICHILGCFFYYIDYILLQQNYYASDSLYNPDAYWLTTSSAFPNIINQDLWVKYTYSFYFSTSLLSGVAYGDLVPQNPLQTLYNTFILLLPLVIYSYIFNSIFNVISKKRERSKLIKKYQLIAKRYLKTLRVKQNLESKLITYLSFIFKKPTSHNEFINSLAPSVKQKYLHHTIKAKFDFTVFDQLLSISPSTDPLRFSEQIMVLIQQQSFPQRYKLILPPSRFKLYYINQGICKRVANRNPKKFSDQFKRKQHFCYYPFLTGLFNLKLTYQSASFVVAQSIDRNQFLNLLKNKDMFQVKESFFIMRDQKILYNNQTIDGQLCFFCNSPAHMFQNCPHLRPKVILQKRDRKRTMTKNKLKLQIYNFHKRQIYFRGRKNTKRLLEKNKFTIYKNEQCTFCQTSVQCDDLGLPAIKIKQGPFEILRFYKIYYPQYNIVD